MAGLVPSIPPLVGHRTKEQVSSGVMALPNAGHRKKKGDNVKSLAITLATLNLTTQTETAGNNIKDLVHSLDNADENGEEIVSCLLTCDIVECLKTVLSSDHAFLHESTAKLTAEIARQECARQCCGELVPALLQLLSSKNIPVLIQVCRALGNICFDNDNGRQVVEEEGGINILMDLLRRQLSNTEDNTERLRVVACGFLLNLTNSAETIQDKAILQSGIEILNDYLHSHYQDENVCQMALLSLGCLIESELGKSKLSECPVAVTVGTLLGTEVGEELQDLIFELLSTMAETDAVKLQLVNSTVIEKILVLIKANEHSKDEDSLAVIKMATELFPTLLHGDVSMETLFQEGKGKLYKESLDWLKSSNEHLQVAGALTIGNFAIKDANCIYLVKQGVHEKMLDILDHTNSAGDNNPGLQHAVFSSLRNLSIPAVNKLNLFKSGVLDRILPYVFKAELTPVQFKMLGTFRLLVDGQEETAVALGKNEEFVNKIMSWCHEESHPGVKAEANRLIAWLVKHSRNAEVMEMIVKCGGTPNLCYMMHSEHAVMQNEALVALTLIATKLLDKVVQNFIESEVVPAIKVVLTDEDTLSEIFCNTVTFVLVLSKSAELKELMKLADFAKFCKSLSESHEDSNLKEQAKHAYSVLK